MHQFCNCLTDIHFLNLSYLLLLQRIAYTHDSSLLTGIDHDVLESIKNLPLTKLTSLAETNQLIIKLRKEIFPPS